ncbi:hypothetical protein Pyn_40424 [Prunus yedoensis var. nudiflora]|uniref:Plastocyanin-like domain-containing protein n=1 Tax=Prunus yedoensis var. nudiflora TaxID=2094558 RepID=A0A314YJJ1_PRUYE|nr:hypothetical protein Pyn_40424 [Prunus yedoensis var. nudiflora]
MTVVSADASYTKPFTTRVLMIGPGQTTDVLLTADQPPAHYYVAASVYQTARNAPFDNTTTTAILEYKSAACSSKKGLKNCTVPNNPRCQGPNNTRFAASMNNVSFVFPRTNSIMQAYYNGVPGVFTTDFPPVPPVQFDYTAMCPGGYGRLDAEPSSTS